MKWVTWWRTINAAGEMGTLQDMEARLRRRGLKRSAEAVRAAYETVEDEAADRLVAGRERPRVTAATRTTENPES